MKEHGQRVKLCVCMCVCARVEIPSCEWGNQICEALEWGPPRKEGEEGEEGGREGCDGWEGAVPRLLARKVPMKEAEELPISPLPALPHEQREAEETGLALAACVDMLTTCVTKHKDNSIRSLAPEDGMSETVGFHHCRGGRVCMRAFVCMRECETRLPLTDTGVLFPRLLTPPTSLHGQREVSSHS